MDPEQAWKPPPDEPTAELWKEPFEGDLRPPPVRSPPRCHRRHELSSQGGGECASPVPPTARGHTGLPRRPGPRRAPLLLPPAQLRRPRRHPKKRQVPGQERLPLRYILLHGAAGVRGQLLRRPPDDRHRFQTPRGHRLLRQVPGHPRVADRLQQTPPPGGARHLPDADAIQSARRSDGHEAGQRRHGRHFLTHLTVESHTQLYSHPDSLDFACVAYFRAAFTPTRRAKLLANLDEVFEFVPRVTALADDNEYVRQIADYKNAIVDRWRAEVLL
ncbi:hypothetical protein L596_016703 [Steinernema carpocapsae]|uniref:Uncharacterized protein n=1 Tax=Steinernema carpocapsae TaxID=34508 RepID=A0A4U5NJU4_STECR|nr:hypothetical protein L596_016703 [Steinernema carpocapsae]